MPDTTTTLSEEQIAEAQQLVNGGALLLPLRVEGWHKSLTDGGWFIRHSTGRTLATVEFVPVEVETGIPALDGNAPARTMVALLNLVPALCQTVRALQAENEIQQKQYNALDEDFREQVVELDDLQARLSEVEKERDTLRDSASIVAFHAHQIDGQIAESLTNAAATRMREACDEAVNDFFTLGQQEMIKKYGSHLLTEVIPSLTLDNVEQKK